MGVKPVAELQQRAEGQMQNYGTEELRAQLTSLKKQQQQLQNQIDLLENRQATVQRKKDARRKILIGAERLNKLNKGEISKEQLWDELDAYLTRPSDRELFGLSHEIPEKNVKKVTSN